MGYSGEWRGLPDDKRSESSKDRAPLPGHLEVVAAGGMALRGTIPSDVRTEHDYPVVFFRLRSLEEDGPSPVENPVEQ